MQFLRREGRQNSRQFHAENRTPFLPVVAENFSAMLLNDTKANAEAQAGALANRLRRIERIENAMGVLEAGTTVGEQDDNVAAVADRFDGHHTARGCFHGFQGVADNVEENLHQLISITAHTGKNGLKLQLDAGRAETKIE